MSKPRSTRSVATSVSVPQRLSTRKAHLGALVCTLATAGCQPTPEPAWHITTLWLRPSANHEIRGLATLQYARARWERRQRDRDHLCAELFELVGEPTDPCADCELAWSLTFTPGDSLCDWAPRVELLPASIAIGPLFDELADTPPVPTARAGSWTFTPAEGWAPHGFVFRGAISAPETGLPAWNGQAPVTAWPAWAVAIDQD